MNFNMLSLNKPIFSNELPPTFMTLDDWVLINVTGCDSEKYLQSQLTFDVTKIHKNQHVLAAHCNAMGRIWSNIILFKNLNGFSFIQPRCVLDIQLKEIKKYSLFSKVNFNYDNKIILLGIAGLKSRTILEKIFSKLPDFKKKLIYNEKIIFLWFDNPSERFLLITDLLTSKILIKKLHNKVQISNSNQWLLLNIEAGIPFIGIKNIIKFIPQDINLHNLGSIDFKKGCYIGQEIIARSRLKAINRYLLCYLIGTFNIKPISGEYLETKLNNIWRHVGTILAIVELENNKIVVQAVINADSDPNSLYRMNRSFTYLKIKKLFK